MPERSKEMKKITLDEVEKVLDGKASAEESLDVLGAAAGNEELGELLTSGASGEDSRDIDFFNKMFSKYEDEIKCFLKKRDKGKVVQVNFNQDDFGIAAALPVAPDAKKKKKK
ncbi:MAG: hypothetical protein KH111_06995 [Bacteroidales bacterium]|nr:hypothetical protein [Bacteroidales bacterium]